MEILSSVETSFADSYSEARAKFLSACTGADVKAWVNPNKGPKGEELASMPPGLAMRKLRA